MYVNRKNYKIKIAETNSKGCQNKTSNDWFYYHPSFFGRQFSFCISSLMALS